jgi:hypothetical protein
VVPTLDAGLALIGDGAVATVVGRLRPNFRVVDVDLNDVRGHAATEAIASWCHAQGLWHLVRPSGGSDGRAHVFVLPEARTADLEAFLEQLRSRFRVSSRAIDPRQSGDVRPLTAPHRHGAHPQPLGALSAALDDLRRRLPASAARPARRASSRSAAAVPLIPRPRRRVDLPQPWARYLKTGEVPPIGGQDRSRTTVEAIATGHLLRAGHTAESAWTIIMECHPAAMTRARASKRRWVAWVWNREVRDDLDRASTQAPTPEVAAAVNAARARLWAFQWTLSARQRPALLLVGHHVLDRMDRTSSRRVPVPERDLVLDTGIKDRKTIRTALRALSGPVGVLHTDSWDSGNPDSSSFEFEIPDPTTDPLAVQGVWEIPPPCSHTPLPAGTWATLPRAAHAVWRVLPPTAGAGLPLSRLCQLAGLTASQSTDPSPSQLRSTTAALAALAQAGLALCGSDASWTRLDEPTTDHAQRADRAYLEQHTTITAERQAFRSPASTSWNLTRARVLKANRTRQRAWWDGLDSSERTRRRSTWTKRFDGLSVLDREQVKAELAGRRLRAGLDEATRHDAWIDNQAPDAYVQSVILRQQWFATLAPPLRQAHAAAWARHRHRFNVPKGSPLASARVEQAQLLPDGRRDRDAAHLQGQEPDQFELGLRGAS